MSSYILKLPEALGERIDCKYHDPETIEKFSKLRNMKSEKGVLVPLKKVADVKGGKRLPNGTIFGNGERDVVPYIRVNDINDGEVDTENCAKIPPEVHEIIKEYQLKKNDILLTIVGYTTGKAGILKSDVDVCNFTENAAKIRILRDDVLPRFVLCFLNSELGQIQTYRFSVGSAKIKLSLKNCRNIEIFIPGKKNVYDIDEQKRILAEFDKFNKLADKNIVKYHEKIRLYNRYFLDFFGIDILEVDDKCKDTFAYELSNDKKARIDVLFNNPKRDLLIEKLKKYPHSRLKKLARIQNPGQLIPSAFYKLVELSDVDGDLGEITNSREVAELKSSKIVLRKGEIIFSKLQPEKGKVALVNEKYEGCVGSSELVPLKIISEEVIDKYLYHFLRSPYVLKQWEYSTRGCSRERIGKPEIYDTLILLPDHNTQLKAIKELDTLILEAKNLLNDYRDLREKANMAFTKEILR